MNNFTLYSLLFTLLVSSSFNVFSQSEIQADKTDTQIEESNSKILKWVDLGIGFFRSDRQYSLYEWNAGLNTVLKNKTYIGLNYRANLNLGNVRYGNRVFTSNHISASFGLKSDLNKTISVIPSVGISYSNFVITGTTYESLLIPNSTEEIAAGEPLVKEEKTYNTFNDSQLGVPMNLRFMFAAKRFGASLDFYILASKYSSTGVRLLLHFGKTR